MGYQVEYFVKLLPIASRQWLSQFEGFWIEPESADDLPYGEFRLWDDLYLHAELGVAVTKFSIPQIKYSWLLRGHEPAVVVVDRLERLMVETLLDVPVIRIDEFVLEEWEKVAGKWEKLTDPVEALVRWLVESEQDHDYFRLLPTVHS